MATLTLVDAGISQTKKIIAFYESNGKYPSESDDCKLNKWLVTAKRKQFNGKLYPVVVQYAIDNDHPNMFVDVKAVNTAQLVKKTAIDNTNKIISFYKEHKRYPGNSQITERPLFLWMNEAAISKQLSNGNGKWFPEIQAAADTAGLSDMFGEELDSTR